MKSPFKANPILRGRDAIRFYQELEENKRNPLSKEKIEEIERDARIIRAMFKKKK